MPKFKSYLIGFILSLVLTLTAYFMVVNNLASAVWAIFVLAAVQLVIQLVFFLHLGQERGSQWNLVILLSTFGIVLIVVVGSLWIMQHLDYNMTPSQMQQYINSQDGT